MKPEWTYSFYRATLELDGKVFAVVTPDGIGPLSYKQAALLLAQLNIIGGDPNPDYPFPMAAEGQKKP